VRGFLASVGFGADDISEGLVRPMAPSSADGGIYTARVRSRVFDGVILGGYRAIVHTLPRFDRKEVLAGQLLKQGAFVDPTAIEGALDDGTAVFLLFQQQQHGDQYAGRACR
jgi:hypothetical protein